MAIPAVCPARESHAVRCISGNRENIPFVLYGGLRFNREKFF